jgi:hypothetical protein
MAIIYTYPEKSTLSLSDSVLITDNSSTDPSKRTKKATVLSLKNVILGGTGTLVNSVTAFTTSDFGKEGIVTTPTSGAVKVGINILPLTDLTNGAIGSDLLFVVDDPSGIPKNKKISIDNFFSTVGLITNPLLSDYSVRLPDAVGTAGQVLKLPAVIGDSAQQLVWSDAGSGSGTGGFETLPFTTANGAVAVGTYAFQMIAPSNCTPANFKLYHDFAQTSGGKISVAIYKGTLKNGGALQSKGEILAALDAAKISGSTLTLETGATAISAGDDIVICFSFGENIGPLGVVPITATGGINLNGASPKASQGLAIFNSSVTISAEQMPSTITLLKDELDGSVTATSRPFLLIY